jgi:hypothetical protein
MPVRTHTKLEVACEQLQAALRLYFARQDHFAIVTLAGAAEEILGVYLKRHNQNHAFDEQLDTTLRLYEWMWKEQGSRDRMHKAINRIKNGAKHMMGKKDTTIVCDERVAARRVLNRAVTNYYKLMDYEQLPGPH